MISDYFKAQIQQIFGYTPTFDQEKAMELLSLFVLSTDDSSLFLLNGYAGTGKSSLVGALVKQMKSSGMKTVLLAPTGRAAKVFSSYCNEPAYTIHRKIYRSTGYAGEMEFKSGHNPHTQTLFIVDESSMISDDPSSDTVFGTGSVLDDLVQYIYSGEGCRLLLMGDKAQLPPVYATYSKALDENYLTGYGLKITSCELKEVVRQDKESGIIALATQIRKQIDNPLPQLPLITLPKFKDMTLVPGDELLEFLETSYRKAGIEETLIVTSSNKLANLYNQAIRNRILYREEMLGSSDQLIVVRNNYFWAKEGDPVDFIANGELLTVKRIRRIYKMYDFDFADATVYFPPYDWELDCKLLLTSLCSETPSLSYSDSRLLFDRVWEDYADIKTKKERMKKMKEDPYWNALQIKFGYAVTCHKAQGGQWKHVYVDQGYMDHLTQGAEYFRWLYTAVTRASDSLFLVRLEKRIQMIE